jgi:hypothetical protein
MGEEGHKNKRSSYSGDSRSPRKINKRKGQCLTITSMGGPEAALAAQ